LRTSIFRIKRNRYPQRMPHSVRLFARQQQTSTRYIHGLALIGSLTKRRGPPQSGGKPQSYSKMGAALHRRALLKSIMAGVRCEYIPAFATQASLGTRPRLEMYFNNTYLHKTEH
jgi:hypothetical protein